MTDVSAVADAQRATPTPSPGWTVADRIGHLTYSDGDAVTALTAGPAPRNR